MSGSGRPSTAALPFPALACLSPQTLAQLRPHPEVPLQVPPGSSSHRGWDGSAKPRDRDVETGVRSSGLWPFAARSPPPPPASRRTSRASLPLPQHACCSGLAREGALPSRAPPRRPRAPHLVTCLFSPAVVAPRWPRGRPCPPLSAAQAGHGVAGRRRLSASRPRPAALAVNRRQAGAC